MFKKTVLVAFVAAAIVAVMGTVSFAAPAPATAGDVIGVIESQKILESHPKYKEAADKLRQAARQKEQEAKDAADKESDNAKKAEVIQKKRMELGDLEQSVMKPIFEDCQKAVRTVAVRKKVSVVLEKASVYIGGTDITEDVKLELAKSVKK